MNKTIFQKIIDREIPANILYEDNDIIAIETDQNHVDEDDHYDGANIPRRFFVTGTGGDPTAGPSHSGPIDDAFYNMPPEVVGDSALLPFLEELENSD